MAWIHGHNALVFCAFPVTGERNWTFVEQFFAAVPNSLHGSKVVYRH